MFNLAKKSGKLLTYELNLHDKGFKIKKNPFFIFYITRIPINDARAAR